MNFLLSPVFQVEALQREACVRNTHWQQQKQREEDLLSDLDSTLFQCLLTVPEANSYQVCRESLLVYSRDAILLHLKQCKESEAKE